MKRIIPYILIVTVAMTSCHQDIFDEPVSEGMEARVQLSISGDRIWNQPSDRSYQLTPIEETQIKSMDVLIFNSAQRLVSRHRIDTPASFTNIINTKSGTGMSIYVVTNLSMGLNANGTVNDVLGMATSVSALKNIKITNLLVDVQTNKTLVMYGEVQSVSINPTGSNTITIPLNYVAAKMTVNIRKSLPVGDDFELVDWKLGSMSRYSYIFPQTLDVVNPSNSADFVTQSTGNTWSDGMADIGGVMTPVKTTTFYLFENRRGITSNTDAKLKSGSTAPLAATQFLARGYYKTPIAIKGIDIIVMLGANSINDYNIERRNQYTYNINIKGINDIAIETRYKDAGVGFQAEIVNPTLDAHYDFRPVKIGAYLGTSTVTILDENNNPTTSAFWLKISEKDITKFINNGSGTYIRPTYNPATEMLQTLSYVHTNPSAMDFKMFYLYSDEFLTDNGVRTAKVVISNVQVGGEVLSPITYTITQRGCLVAGRVGLRVINSSNVMTTTDYVLATEIYEEATMAITPGNLANERTSTMQWGFSGLMMLPSSNYTYRNGFDNTLNLSLSNITNGTLRTPYGRTGNTTITHQTYDPIYNTYAARYCFEKNRDTNGDGVIKDSEIRWYLPSVEEQSLIYAGNTSWSSTTTDRWTGNNVYLSSTQYSTVEAMASRYATGLTGTILNNTSLYVRCVRQL